MEVGLKHTKKEMKETIERRFQFILLLALYLPVIWDKTTSILKSFSLAFDYQLILGTIITSLLLSYVFSELLKNEFTTKILSVLENLTLAASYLLVTIIGTVSLYDFSNPTSWKFFVIGFATIFLGFSAYTIIILNVCTMWKPILKLFRGNK